MISTQASGSLSSGDMGPVVARVLIPHRAQMVTCLQGRSERTRPLACQVDISEVPLYEQPVRDAAEAPEPVIVTVPWRR